MAKSEQSGERALPAATDSRPSSVAAKTAETRATDPRSDDAGSAGLEQIREILCGGLHRDLERRLVRADAHLSARAHELEQENRRRTDVLESHLKQETEALAARLERELAELGDALRKISREQHEAIANLEQKLAKVEEASARGQRETRRQLLDQAKSFLDELQQLRKELFATLQQELRLAEGELMGELYGAEEHPGH